MLIELPANDLTFKIIGCGVAVHRELGPGLLESTYKPCLIHELQQAGLSTEIEVPVPVIYKGIHMECGYRLDLLVNGEVVVEIKSVERLAPVHTAQMVTYLRLTGYEVGLLMNFNTLVLKDGVKRVLKNALPVGAPRGSSDCSEPL